MKRIFLAVAVCTFLAVSATVSALAAAEKSAEFGLSLMHPGSFEGWNHGPKPIKGWEVDGKSFCGKAGGVELLSGFSFDCSEIRLKWVVLDEGKLQVRMPEVPNGKGLTLTLCEGDGCGRLTDGDTVLTPGISLESVQTKSPNHTLILRRVGGKISVKIGDRELYTLPLDTKRRFGLALFVEAGKAVVSDIRAEEPLNQTLFNGKDLTGWRQERRGQGKWIVDKGDLVLRPGRAFWIRSIKDYENFTIAYDYKIKKGGNSGLAIRTPRIGWPSNDGMEIQIMDRPKSRGVEEDSLLSIYSNVPPICRVDKPLTEPWNRVVIKADGWMVSAWLNGHLVQQYNTKFHPELRYRPLKGWLGFQDHGRWVRFRNIKLHEAPDGEGLKAWYAHPEKNGASLLVDRLMNSEFLAMDHGLRSGVASKHIDGASAGEHVLADLKGPGVVTCINIPKETDGQIAFYFDGEKKPRIIYEPSELSKKLPKINYTGSPLVAMLCYEKLLKIVAQGGKQIDSRIEYVSVPKTIPVHSFVSTAYGKTGIPRGWEAPPEFRSDRIKKGTYHEYDPAKTVRAAEVTVYVGGTVPMLHFDGAGTVKYLMLHGNPAALQSNDLWIEVTYDRESKPAISVPARFWLPALVKQDGFPNFVFRSFYGKASHIGIPFGDGITISLVNRGKRKIQNVGLEASVVADEHDPHGQPVGPMRLHAQYVPAGKKSDLLFDKKGKGRLVGIVLAAPKGVTPGIAKLEVDAKTVDGWASPDLASLLGSKETNFAGMTSGNRDGMAWRYFLPAPIDFEKSIRLESTSKDLPDRVMLYYVDEK